jgi:glycosyltransferase involved in cell wall biosynthesis
MLCGTPSIASDLPGVRQPPRMTGMGEVVPIGDSSALAEAIIRILQNRSSYLRPRPLIEETFSLERTMGSYETLFEELLECRSREQRRADSPGLEGEQS